MPSINHDRCTLCGECIKDCPRQILGVNDKKIAVTADNCMLCAHCHAVCPEDAVTFPREILREAAFRSFASSDKATAPGEGDPGALVAAVRSRRSVRRYKDLPVARETLDDIVEFAATAPSGTNYRAWEFSVVNGKGGVAELAGMIRAFYERLNRMAKNPATRYLS
ncbi:MAG: nitroreductase family protein, partial [Myxococcota bacterium]